MQLIDLLTADDVVFAIRGADIGAAAASLLRITLPRHGVEPAETERLVQAVLARERETPTLCGAIAIPHARDARVKEFIVSIAVNPAGVVEGAYCVGCCWALMAALFALGVMGITWMVVIAAVIAIEKLWPSERVAEGATIGLLLALALGVAFFPAQLPGLTVPM